MCLRMNRETRKTNLRKLQLSGTSTVRRTRSSKATTTAASSPSVSNYFTTPQVSYSTESFPNEYRKSPVNSTILLDNPVETQNEVEPNSMFKANVPPNRSKRTKLTSFLNGKDAFSAPADDFATPAKQVKKAPRIKKSNTTAKSKNSKTRSSQQPKIKSAFLRNEQMFAEITAQHCIADNINPDDMQLALAISQSQAEAEAKAHNDYPLEREEEVIIDLLAEDCTHNTATIMDESIRSKLQKYGFRTTQRTDYGNYAAMYARSTNQRRNKCKWANKFTALTLRQPEIQTQKLKQKIDALLTGQCTTEPSEAVDQHTKAYAGFSTIIKSAICIENDIEIVKRTDENLTKYFVDNLFEVRNLKSGHLLKDWSAIQGRDKSPIASRQKEISNNEDNKTQELQRIYEELDNFFKKPQPNENETICENISEISSSYINQVEMNAAPDNSIQLQASLTETVEIKSNDVLNCVLNTDDLLVIKTNEIPPTYRDSKPNSPDIFADSDIEMEAPEMELESSISKNDTTNNNFIPIKDFNSTDVNAAESPKENMQSVDKFLICPNEDIVSEMSSNIIDLTCSDDENIEIQGINTANRDSDVEMHSSNLHKEQNCSSSLKRVSDSLHSSTTPLTSTQPELPSLDGISENYLSPKKTAISPTYATTIIVDSPKSVHEFSFLDLIQDEDSSSPQKSAALSTHKKLTTSISFDSLPLREQASTTSHRFFDEDFSHINSSKLQKAITSLSQSFKKSSPLSAKKASISFLHDYSLAENLPANKTTKHEFSFPNDTKADTSTISKSYSCNSIEFTRTPSESIPKVLSSWSAERAEYGILESHSEPLTQSPSDWGALPMSRSPTPESTTPMKLYGNRNISEKFAQLIQSVTADSNGKTLNAQLNESFDEFDKLTYGSPIRATATAETKAPSGLNELLTAELSFESCRPSVDLKTPEKTKCASDAKDSPCQQVNGASEKMLVNGHKYAIRLTITPKPDFTKQSMAELERQLYKYGIKPMSRKSAVKILEYIYNQTHPIVESEEMKSPTTTNDSNTPNSQPSAINNSKTYVEGINMLLSKYLQTTTPKLRANEDYILPKRGPTKQRPGPVLPLHIAWHNLLCSNVSLYESVLSYEPIDIHKVAGSFKCLGLSYEKMHLERFLNGRCIIYRNENEPTNNRHVRKCKQ